MRSIERWAWLVGFVAAACQTVHVRRDPELPREKPSELVCPKKSKVKKFELEDLPRKYLFSVSSFPVVIWEGCGRLFRCEVAEEFIPVPPVPLPNGTTPSLVGVGRDVCEELSGKEYDAIFGRLQQKKGHSVVTNPDERGLLDTGLGNEVDNLAARARLRARESRARFEANPADPLRLQELLAAYEQTEQWVDAKVAWHQHLAASGDADARVRFERWLTDHALVDTPAAGAPVDAGLLDAGL